MKPSFFLSPLHKGLSAEEFGTGYKQEFVLGSLPEGAPSSGGLCWASLPGMRWLSIGCDASLAGDSAPARALHPRLAGQGPTAPPRGCSHHLQDQRLSRTFLVTNNGLIAHQGLLGVGGVHANQRLVLALVSGTPQSSERETIVSHFPPDFLSVLILQPLI